MELGVIDIAVKSEVMAGNDLSKGERQLNFFSELSVGIFLNSLERCIVERQKSKDKCKFALAVTSI